MGKQRQVDAPVAPDVTTIIFIILVGILVRIEVLPQLGVHLHQEILLADGNPIEFGLRGEEARHLLSILAASRFMRAAADCNP